MGIRLPPRLPIFLIMFRIVKTSDHAFAASVHRGVNIVKGTGKVWNTRLGLTNGVISSICGYCAMYRNDVSFDTLSIHDVIKNKFIPVGRFLTEKEITKVKNELVGDNRGYTYGFKRFLKFKGLDIYRPWDKEELPEAQRLILFDEYLLAIEDKWRKVGLKTFTF